MAGGCADCDFNEEIMGNMDKRIARLEERLKDAVEALKSISKTNIRGENVYAGADSMIEEAKEALKELGEV